MPYHVPISLHPILRDPPFVFVLFWLGTAIGYRLLRACGAPFARVSALERGVLCATIGLGALQYLPFTLGMVGALTPRALWIALLALLALFGVDMFAVARGAWNTLFRGTREVWRPPSRWLRIGMLLLSIPLTLAFLKALTPPTDPDGIGYHLTAAKRWLQSGHLGYLPTFTHTNAPMGVDMLYTIALGVWSDTAAKLIHFGFGLLALLSIFALGRRLRDENVGFAAAALWLLGPHKENTLQQFSWAYVELASTTQITCVALAWLVWRRERAFAWLFAAILCAGFAMTTKLTNGLAGVVLGLLVMGTFMERRSRSWRILGCGAAVSALALLPAVPWLWRTWILTGNPVYPMFSSLFPTRDWSAQSGHAFTLYFKYYNWGEMLSHRLSLPQRMLLCYIAECVLIVVTTAIVWRWRDAETRLLALAVGIMALFAVQTTGLYLRFFIPLLALIYLLLGAAGARLLARSRWLHGFLHLFLLVKVVSIVAEDAPFLPLNTASATGSLPRAQFLRAALPGLYESWEFANQHVEPGAHILAGPMVSYAHGATYYCDRSCYVTDAYLQFRIRMDTWEHFLGDIKRDDIDYVLVQTPVEYRHAGPDYLPAKNEEPFVGRLAHSYGRPLFASGYFTLYRLVTLPPVSIRRRLL